MNKPVCVFGSRGKIGSMFQYDWNPSHKKLNLSDERFHTCKTFVLCNHNRDNFESIVLFTYNILNSIPDSSDVTIINIASDAELIPIPTRLAYGKKKLHIREQLTKRKNRIINIFFPYVTPENWDDLNYQISQLNFTRDYYYLSTISKIVRPIAQPSARRIKSFIDFPVERWCYTKSFNSKIIHDMQLYNDIRHIIEDEYRIDLQENVNFGLLMWQLTFTGSTPIGKMHVDMQRCLFGNMFRALVCTENDSDYMLDIDGEMYEMDVGDIIVIPAGIKHQPLETTYGTRKIIVIDYFTSNIPNVLFIILFIIFNNLKFLGINV